MGRNVFEEAGQELGKVDQEMECDVCKKRRGQAQFLQELKQDKEREGVEQNIIEETRVVERVKQTDQMEKTMIEEAVKMQERDQEQIRGLSQQIRRQEAIGLENFEMLIERWQGKCAVCNTIKDPVKGVWHETMHCGREEATDVKQGIVSFRKTVRWGRYSYCFECGLPQTICRQWESDEKGIWKVKGQCCQYPNVLVEAVIAIFVLDINGSGSAIAEWMEEEGVDGSNMEEWTGWFARTIRWGGIQTNQMAKVFGQVAEFVVKQ